MAEAPAAPAAPAPPTDINDELPDVPDVPLTGNPAPVETPAETPPEGAPAEPAKDDGAATPPADPAKDDGKPADPTKAEDGKETPPTDPAKADQQEQQPTDPKDLTPEDRQRLAQQAFRQRQQTRNQVAQRIDQVYGPKTEEDLINEGVDPKDAQVEALRQDMYFREQRAQIAELNAGMQADAVNVMHDMPVFDANSKQYDEAFARQVEDAYKIASRVQYDDAGIVLAAELPLYSFYKQMHDIYQRGNTNGATAQQAAEAAMLANTETPGGSSSTSKGPLTPEDELAEMEARLGDAVIT